ncbi:hypothetical protein [Rhizomonospora bruguierae]|uniref:hypothetical protein n=1 Tax=Rhizomonospora bruguierae TaxID=1581705 RepID=UPI001BCC3560|nr:hypothetical protein [Micromonospora sp. NBRC 107566]
MSTSVPELLTGLVDDAAVFPPAGTPLPRAVAAHREHRAAWYAPMVGPLLVPASGLGDLPALLGPQERLEVGLVGDTGLAGLPAAVAAVRAEPRLVPRQVEVAVAKRGEDPQPGLRTLADQLSGWPDLIGYAEIPLARGLIAALDTVAEARAAGAWIAPKFRTGGLAAELFPTPMELAAVICACRDRSLPFKLTAGLHRAIRRTDPETGFVHHGFLNVLAAALRAAAGAEVIEVAELLAAGSAGAVAGGVATGLHRPLLVSFGSCSVAEPVQDLVELGMMAA